MTWVTIVCTDGRVRLPTAVWNELTTSDLSNMMDRNERGENLALVLPQAQMEHVITCIQLGTTDQDAMQWNDPNVHIILQLCRLLGIELFTPSPVCPTANLLETNLHFPYRAMYEALSWRGGIDRKTFNLRGRLTNSISNKMDFLEMLCLHRRMLIFPDHHPGEEIIYMADMREGMEPSYRRNRPISGPFRYYYHVVGDDEDQTEMIIKLCSAHLEWRGISYNITLNSISVRIPVVTQSVTTLRNLQIRNGRGFDGGMAFVSGRTRSQTWLLVENIPLQDLVVLFWEIRPYIRRDGDKGMLLLVGPDKTTLGALIASLQTIGFKTDIDWCVKGPIFAYYSSGGGLAEVLEHMVEPDIGVGHSGPFRVDMVEEMVGLNDF